MESLTELKVVIENDIETIDKLMQELITLDKFADSLDDPESQFLITQDILKKGRDFEELSDKLEGNLKIYLEKEASLNLPLNFSYKKLYNQLSH